MWSYIYSWFYPEPPTKQVIYEKDLLNVRLKPVQVQVQVQQGPQVSQQVPQVSQQVPQVSQQVPQVQVPQVPQVQPVQQVQVQQVQVQQVQVQQVQPVQVPQVQPVQVPQVPHIEPIKPKFTLQSLSKEQLANILAVKLKKTNINPKKEYEPRHPVLKELLSKKSISI